MESNERQAEHKGSGPWGFMFSLEQLGGNKQRESSVRQQSVEEHKEHDDSANDFWWGIRCVR
jgi:hypothetical protein